MTINFKTIVRPTMTYGSDCWAVKKKDENKLNPADMRMFRWARGMTRLNPWLKHIINGEFRKGAHVKPVANFLENKRLKLLATAWGEKTTTSVRLEVSGRQSRNRPKKWWRDNIKEDMKKYQLTEYMAQYRKYWMTQIMTGPAQGDCQERWNRKYLCTWHGNTEVNYEMGETIPCK